MLNIIRQYLRTSPDGDAIVSHPNRVALEETVRLATASANRGEVKQVQDYMTTAHNLTQSYDAGDTINMLNFLRAKAVHVAEGGLRNQELALGAARNLRERPKGATVTDLVAGRLRFISNQPLPEYSSLQS